MQTIGLEKHFDEYDATSSFRTVIVAALRAKQLLRGAKPRIETDPGRRKLTSIALEEVRRKLVGFKVGVTVESDADFRRPLVTMSPTRVQTEKSGSALT